MTYRIAVCDDRDEDAAYLETLVLAWAKKAGHRVRILKFPSAEAFLFQAAEEEPCEILLLDIEMGGMNGVELAKTVRRQNTALQIVFVTGFPDFIAEGYEVAALHYLIKPVRPDKLYDVLDRAVKNLGRQEKTAVFHLDGQIRRVPVGEILYVEAFAHSCTVHTLSGSFDWRAGISDAEKMLPGEDFVRCHRSYLVGLRYIRTITRTELTLDDGRVLPLSRRRYDAVNQAFIRYYKEEIS